MRRFTVAVAAALLTASLAGAPPVLAGEKPGPAVSLIARLSGDQGLPGKGGTAPGDKDGKAVALIKVKGDRVTFALSWNGIERPVKAHLHQGQVGASGPVRARLFGTRMPATVRSAAGQTSVTGGEVAEKLRTDPGGFYVDLHSAEFPGGAVRGQLRVLAKPVNPLSIIRGGKLRALADGGQEVPGGDPAKSGDPDGHSTTFLYPEGSRVGYSLAWVNTGAPLAAHLYEGVLGQNGDVRLPLFVSPVPKNIFAVSGSVDAPDAALLARLKKNPTGFYANLHTAKFPDGAVRGQLFR
ncbi:CHRD domain-containing protein [Streptomyces sp. NPDC087300]|uniref:CHRD domain-containing protein n=1 Tax=Streptomyces sp. NPDC087300 TaxID=3365780 RepID=UPI00382DEB13